MLETMDLSSPNKNDGGDPTIAGSEINSVPAAEMVCGCDMAADLSFILPYGLYLFLGGAVFFLVYSNGCSGKVI